MEISALVEKLPLKVLCAFDNLGREVKSVYCSDMLSRVMGGASKDSVLITVQTHMNVVAIASLIEISCIILPEGLEAEEEVLAKATSEGIPILSSDLTAFELCVRLYLLGLGKNENCC